jgi:hypothetical protein
VRQYEDVLKRADVLDQDLLIRFKNKNIWVTKHSAAGAGGSVDIGQLRELSLQPGRGQS